MKGRKQQLNGGQILKYFTVNRKNTIELDQMVKNIQKSTLSGLPDSEKELCETILHEFIFTEKSFEMPVKDSLSHYTAHTNKHK